jgi:hypothetical protein
MLLARPPAVAGTFYPGARNQLAAAVDGFLRDAATRHPPSRSVPKAIIAPHAGYVYSGAIAASVYALLAPARGSIERVVLLGPSHRVPVRGLATTSAASFLTPLGAVPIDRAGREAALRLPGVHVGDEAHAFEHSLEVHLPFLQQVLGEFSLVPFSVGDASPEVVAAVLEALWGGPETLIVVSTDLSHYEDYDTARALDAETARVIEAFDARGLGPESACGRVPVRGLLVAARHHGLEVETVDLRNSGDTAGPRDRVVGYGAWAFREPAASRDRAPEQAPAGSALEGKAWEPRFDALLLDVARRSIEAGARAGQPLAVDPADYPTPLRALRSSFVTLRLDGELRGCIGSLEATLPLVVDVARSALRAAYHDPRFTPVSAAERPRLELHVSVLEPSVPMWFDSEADLLRQLQPGVDGLILREGDAQATFLPDVWESLPEPRDFLAQLKRKAGLPADYWSRRMQVRRYETRSIG